MYDLAVIGLGVAGLEAINIALKNDLKVIAFESGEIGGTCLNVGCIPTTQRGTGHTQTMDLIFEKEI